MSLDYSWAAPSLLLQGENIVVLAVVLFLYRFKPMNSCMWYWFYLEPLVVLFAFCIFQHVGSICKVLQNLLELICVNNKNNNNNSKIMFQCLMTCRWRPVLLLFLYSVDFILN